MKSTTSPQICCNSTLQNLHVLYDCSFILARILCSIHIRHYRVTTLQTLKFPDNSLTIRGTPDHSYHACTTSVKVDDQTVKFIFNDNDFIMITKSLLTPLWKILGNFPWQDFFPDNSLTFPWLLVKFLTFPWHLYNSMTFPGFPDKWSPWH